MVEGVEMGRWGVVVGGKRKEVDKEVEGVLERGVMEKG